MNAPRRLGALVVTLGLLIAAGPTAMVVLSDHWAARRRSADVARWQDDQPSLPRPSRRSPAAAPMVIEPGRDGYLLVIPKLELSAVVHELEPTVFAGKNTATLKRFGLGQVPFTSQLRNVSPGAEGTAVIAGHRTTSGAPFRHLNQLGPGDIIVVRKAGHVQRWTVAYSVTTKPHEVGAIASQPGTRRLVIMACSPPFSAAERLIVYAVPSREGAH